jgi:hypothetical protein
MKPQLFNLVLSCVLLLTMAACNLGALQAPPTLSAEQEATRVAEIVAATLAAEGAGPDGETAVVDVPTNTPIDTLTAEPTHTPTTAPVVTPSPGAGDPKAGLGEPAWRDEFNAATGWSPFEDDFAKSEIKDGKLIFTGKTIEGGSRWMRANRQVEDFYLETVAGTGGTCAGQDRYGLLFRAPDASIGFLFALTCGGQFRLWIWDGGAATVLVDWTAHAAINKGPNQTNVVGVRAEGQNIKLYANGTQLAEVNNGTYLGSHYFGVMVGAGATPNFTASFEEIAYWVLP